MESSTVTLGPIRLAPGVRRRHVFAYLFAAFVSIALFTYLATLTPYVLDVHLGVPAGEQGQVAGALQFWQEIVLLGFIGWWGAASDRFGRRPVYVLGFLVLATSYFLYPTATSVGELMAWRIIFGVAVAALTAMLATVVADYAHDDSRGKLTGLSFLLNGVGAVLSFGLLTRLPGVFARGGADPDAAGRYAYWVLAALAVLAAAVMLGLKPGRPAAVRERTSTLVLLRDGLLAGRNPRIALAYAGAFAARADMAAISLFLTLWLVQSATAAGATASEAAARSGLITGVALLASMAWSPLFGAIGDRVSRLALATTGFLLAAGGYGLVSSLDDILAPVAIPALVLLGIGQSSTVLSSSVLLAQESPPGMRGAVFGLQSLCGAIGILVLSALGGWLYDAVGPQAPIAAIAVANGVVGLLALGLQLRERRAGAAATPSGTGPAAPAVSAPSTTGSPR